MEEQKPKTTIPVIFLDRDGVINVQAPPHQYITKWDDFKYLPGVYEALTTLKRRQYKLVIVSNQRCVARGMATTADIETLNRKLMDDLRAHACPIDKIFYCPHDASDNCACRKPKPGMLIQAEEEFRAEGLIVDKKRSWMIGDFMSDVQTGINYGINTVHVHSGGTDTSEQSETVEGTNRHLEANSLLEAVKMILEERT